MDTPGFWQFCSLLAVLLALLGEDCEAFLARDVSRTLALRQRGIGLQQALHEIRDRKKTVAARREERNLHEKSLDIRSYGYGRVSYQECNLDEGRRLDCGYFGIKEDACATRECCYGETRVPDVPWCYHSIPTIGSQCLEDFDERVECGWYGIRKEQCLAKNCCWQPSSQGGVPWCYNALQIPIHTGECGVPAIHPSVLSRIVGGVVARAHSYPWMASLQIDREHFCGGTLINDQWVVSAAHCEPAFSWGTTREVVLGMHSRSTPGPSHVRVRVDEIISHEDYEEDRGTSNDIMLLKLATPIEFTNEITPVCLPEQDFAVSPGRRCYTTGWGDTQEGGSMPDLLQQVMVPIISNDDCNKKSWYNGAIDETMVCAGYQEGGRDSCQGDSGGPLVCYEEDAWTLQGVVSWGDGCAHENKPGLYAKVSKYINWIQSTILNNS